MPGKADAATLFPHPPASESIVLSSIRKQLLAGLLATVLAGLALAGVLIYRQSQSEANALFDYQLRATAAALPSVRFSSVVGQAGEEGEGEGIVIQIWSHDGVQLYYSHPQARLAPRAELGFATEHTPRGDWRVYSAIVGDNVVQLAQPMSVRDHLAAEMAWRTLWPLSIILPVLAWLVWLIVGRGLRPLARVAAALETREPNATGALPPMRLPDEVRPLKLALDGLLQRLADALQTQRAFVADAAHELRTPLAALQIQLQLLERARDDAQRREALADLKTGVARATRLVGQLLTLARAQPEAQTAGLRSVELDELLRECVLAHAALAVAKGLDLGIEPANATTVTIDGDPDPLRTLFGNLIDNAVKYTPRDGRIDVSLRVDDGTAQVCIDDSGPGIPPDERERVFDRFYRCAGAHDGGAPAGSGLGLAIVRDIAGQHRATVALEDVPGRAGLRARVAFPLSAASVTTPQF
jgi:two-component system OmpR family sensor kinase